MRIAGGGRHYYFTLPPLENITTSWPAPFCSRYCVRSYLLLVVEDEVGGDADDGEQHEVGEESGGVALLLAHHTQVHRVLNWNKKPGQ